MKTIFDYIITIEEAYRLAQDNTDTIDQRTNYKWLIDNGYVKYRKMISGKRKYYFVRKEHLDIVRDWRF